MNARVFQLIYFSQANKPTDSSILADILATSRANNDRLGISGLLLYENRHFLQVLEGERDSVEVLYRSIKRDPRHKNVTLITTIDEAERLFTGWAMAHYEFGPEDAELLQSFVQITGRSPANSATDYADAESAMRFVGAFRDILNSRGG